MSIQRLDIEELNVESFNIVEPATPVVQPYMIEWTGCMSDCSGCGHVCMQVAGGVY